MVIGMLYFWDVNGREVETPSLRKGKPYFMVSMINFDGITDIVETINICSLEFVLGMLM